MSRLFSYATAGIVVLFISGVIWMLVEITERRKELMAQCLADGHKEYQCYGILRGRR